LLKKDLLALFTDFHAERLDLSRINFGIITLIPQKKRADNIKQFSPICLLNVCVKIFPKVLSIRFDPVLIKIVLSCENVFIKTRDIMDGVCSLHEILHESRHKINMDWFFKIDFEKLYDKVSWGFRFICLQKCGCTSTWCGWIKTLVVGASLCVKINNFLGITLVITKE
jgi:hypothetical protein